MATDLRVPRDDGGQDPLGRSFTTPASASRSTLPDITYGTNNEFGFDYLRDNMKFSLEEYQCQRGHRYAIIDEVDSILVDEARTPLIISGPAKEAMSTCTTCVDRVVIAVGLSRRTASRRRISTRSSSDS